jgi:hypothetical protein
MSCLDGVDNALGLVGKRNDAYSTFAFEEISDKVRVVDKNGIRNFLLLVHKKHLD